VKYPGVDFLSCLCFPQASLCPPNYTGEKVLTALGFDEEGSLEFNAGMLVVLMMGFLAAGYLALYVTVKRRK
jgi:hypothetical protein